MKDVKQGRSYSPRRSLEIYNESDEVSIASKARWEWERSGL